jgi:hypothetical protein
MLVAGAVVWRMDGMPAKGKTGFNFIITQIVPYLFLRLSEETICKICNEPQVHRPGEEAKHSRLRSVASYERNKGKKSKFYDINKIKRYVLEYVSD